MASESSTVRPEADPSRHAVNEIAAAANVSRPKARLLYRACKQLKAEQLRIVETMVELVERGTSDARLRSIMHGLASVLEEPLPDTASEVLDAVDEPIDEAAGTTALIWSGTEEAINRDELLAQSVSVNTACQLAGRSRQQLEALRRSGRLLALKAGGRWRYPRWQLDPDSPTGILPGLSEVIKHLRLSPAAAAFWLTRSRSELGGRTPLEMLQRRTPDPVLELAERHGYLP
jgi:hypothetical protein